MSKLSEAVAIELKKIKDRHGLKYNDIALSLGVSRQALHKIISGGGQPSIDFIDRLVEVYGLELIIRRP